MNAAEVIRRLYREQQDWRAAGEGPEVSWTCRGLARALEIVKGIVKAERIKAQERRPRISRWVAGELYNAVRVASDKLKRGDRARAIEILDRAKASADQRRRAI